ncbi:N-6 DNA methylase [Streptomyces sp. 846.5]|nr:N-6 DNA methylase [Streptomyces sp. 846.5]TDU04186.1 N-6 DNA methylase [Streptomyces sp. 846.5]
MNPDESAAMTAAAIARLAGVGRAAVSNWRRRYPEFPQAVGGTEASPTFSRAEVLAWLQSTGKGDQLATAGRTDTGTELIGKLPPLPREPLHRLRVRIQEPGVEHRTPGRLLAEVMVSLLPWSTAPERPVNAADADSHAVLDPACGSAALLMAAADRFSDRIKVVGQDNLEAVTKVATYNLSYQADHVPYEIHTGDSLLDNQLTRFLGSAAAVVCEPPFDQPQWPSVELTTDPRWEFGIPAPRDGELAWVQHCYAHLRPRATAVVAVTARTCVQASGRHIRAALVRSGALRDVIALPEGIGSIPDTHVCLWVLQRPYGAPDHAAVRMVDLSGLPDAADAPQEFAAWQRLFERADPSIVSAVPRLELLDGDANLLPSRHVTMGVEIGAGDLALVTDRLQALHARIGRGLPRFTAPGEQPRHSYVTFGELERVGALTIRPRDTTPRAGDLLMRTLGRQAVIATGTASDDSGVAQVIEIDATRLDPHFVATFLRADANAQPVTNTLGALSREDLRRCRIPRMPLTEQHRYGAAFRQLEELDGILASLAAVGARVIEQTVYGLTTGVLAPRSTTVNKTGTAFATDDETSNL